MNHKRTPDKEARNGRVHAPAWPLTEGGTGERSETDPTVGGGQQDQPTLEHNPHPNPEVEAKARRRTFSAAYKAKILAKAEACQPGELGALLRKEGLYHAALQRWRRQLNEGKLEGLTPKKRGPAINPDTALRQQLAKLEKENQRLAKRLANAELIIDVQKKVASLLGLPLTADDLGERK